MKITALVENCTDCGMKTAHGLALYIETKNHKMMFDLGPNETLFENAEKLGIDLTAIDTVLISHGHRDHGGALGRFLELNDHAKVYIQEKALDPHFAHPNGGIKDISLDASLKGHPQVICLNGDAKIDEELEVFVVTRRDRCHSFCNDSLFAGDVQDDFLHEQYLIIREETPVLILGCGHTGIVNILDRAKDFDPKICIGGYHLFNPDTGARVSDELLDEIISELKSYEGRQYYTCHCTGTDAFDYMCARMDNMNYLSCGEALEIRQVNSIGDEPETE